MEFWVWTACSCRPPPAGPSLPPSPPPAPRLPGKPPRASRRQGTPPSWGGGAVCPLARRRVLRQGSAQGSAAASMAPCPPCRPAEPHSCHHPSALCPLALPGASVGARRTARARQPRWQRSRTCLQARRRPAPGVGRPAPRAPSAPSPTAPSARPRRPLLHTHRPLLTLRLVRIRSDVIVRPGSLRFGSSS